MQTSDKQLKKSAEKAKTANENLQSSAIVNNFATILYINPMTDFGFKKIFGVAGIMTAFLNDLIMPDSPIREVTFLDKEKLPEHEDQRGVIYDLLCKTEDGSEFIVEMQNAPQARFSDRVVFYLSRSIAPQGQKGTVDGRRWNYELRPVYGVFLINFHLSDRERLKLRTLHLTVEENNHQIFSDKLNAYIIELPCIKGLKEEDCKTKIERWMYNLYNMETTKKPLAFQDIMPVFKEVASQAEFNSMSPEEQQRYMYALDEYRSNMAAWDYSMELGIEKGIEKGIEIGILKSAKALKENGVPATIISVSLGLSVEEIEKL